MIGLLGWLEIISLALKFPDAIMRLVQAFKDTPSENHEQLLQKIEAEARTFAQTGRPTAWE